MGKLDCGFGHDVSLAEVEHPLHRGFLCIVPESSTAG
jgi:hypothetical protein